MSASDALELSVIVPTHNRRVSVLRLLERLRAQAMTATGIDAKRFEVIVVADGCNDDTVAQLHRSVDDGAWPFHVIVIDQSPARGAGIARNAGAARAEGALLIFVDDDIEPFPTMLAAHAAAHAAVPNGESLVLVGAPTPVRPTPATLHDIAAWGWWEQQFEQMSAPGHRFTYDEIFTGILSMPASLFRSVGGFDESLGDCHEDSELGLRLFRAGARGGFSRSGGGVHHEMRDMHRLLPRKFAEGRADVRIAQRWPELAGYLRISWRRPPWHTMAGVVRWNAFRAPGVARVLTRLALPVLSLLSRLRLRHQWRQLHGGTLVQGYWLGVAAEVGSEESLARRMAAAGDGWTRWSDATRWLSINLADGLEEAERLLDINRPDALRVRLDDLPVGTIDPLPTAERLLGRHLRRLLATTLAHELRTALALREAFAGTSAPLGELPTFELAGGDTETAGEATIRISVIVPAWNAAGTLRVALNSLQAQTMPDWEAIVIDDGSTDATAAIVAEYTARDHRFRLVQQSNGGLSAARNAGIRAASSPWLHFLDADDWMAPTAFERMAAVLTDDPTLDVVHCGWARVAEDGRLIAESRCWQVGDLFATFAVRCAIAVHACLVRRSVVIAAGGFDAQFRITQ
ncbi:MAG: glycosyltransferase family A protein, partial [Gemmatimonadota bacterium]